MDTENEIGRDHNPNNYEGGDRDTQKRITDPNITFGQK